RGIELAALDLQDHPLVLVFHELRDRGFVAALDEVGVGEAPGGQDLAALVDQRLDQRVRVALVLGLNVIHDATIFDVCVESGDHGTILDPPPAAVKPRFRGMMRPQRRPCPTNAPTTSGSPCSAPGGASTPRSC